MNITIPELSVVVLIGASMRAGAHRERLLAVKRGEMPWAEVDARRMELHRDFECVPVETKLPERPDYEASNWFLIKACREMDNRE